MMRVMPRPTFSPVDTDFRAALKIRVGEYFARSGRSPNADWRMVTKTVIFFGAFAGLMIALNSGVLPWFAACLALVALGVVIAGIGFNIAHDAVHGSYSKNRVVNRVLGFWFDVLGASSYNWSRDRKSVV